MSSGSIISSTSSTISESVSSSGSSYSYAGTSSGSTTGGFSGAASLDGSGREAAFSVFDSGAFPASSGKITFLMPLFPDSFIIAATNAFSSCSKSPLLVASSKSSNRLPVCSSTRLLTSSIRFCSLRFFIASHSARTSCMLSWPVICFSTALTSESGTRSRICPSYSCESTLSYIVGAAGSGSLTGSLSENSSCRSSLRGRCSCTGSGRISFINRCSCAGCTSLTSLCSCRDSGCTSFTSLCSGAYPGCTSLTSLCSCTGCTALTDRS